MDTLSIPELARLIQTESDAYLFMERLRWNGRPVCPHCGSDAVNYIRPLNGVGRATRTGSLSERRVWKCQACPGRKQFSVLTGTIFHGTKIPVKTWLFVVFEMCSSKNGVAAREIERKYQLTAKSAWFMLHRIREAMKRDPLAGMLRGTVVADETFIGGKTGNKHKSKRPYPPASSGPVPYVPGEHRPGPVADKVAVLSLVDTASGEVRSQVVRDVTGATLRKAISEQVDMANTVLHTDEAPSYKSFASELAGHKTVNHSADEYVQYEDGEVITTNHAEGFFSQLKRSLDGTHHCVSKVHLHRYLGEFDYRYTTRKIKDTDRMVMLMGQVEHRLSYKPLTQRD